MKGTALIFRPEIREPEIRFLEGEPGLEFQQATLKLLQETVGGYIETVPGWTRIDWDGVEERCIVFCNEDGKGQKLPVNRFATQLWHKILPPPGLLRPDGSLADVLVGAIVVVFGDREFMAEL